MQSANSTSATGLLVADAAHLEQLLPLVRDCHAFEKIDSSEEERRKAVMPLLGENPYGRIWLITEGGETVGYIVVCFGYSIEMGGRDAFIDEFFVVEAVRGRGLGRQTLARIQEAAAQLGIVMLHLEVDRENGRARHLYESLGFEARDRYHLMSCRLQG